MSQCTHKVTGSDAIRLTAKQSQSGKMNFSAMNISGPLFQQASRGRRPVIRHVLFLFFNFIDQKYISHNIFIVNILFDNVVGSESHWSKNVFTDTYIFRAELYIV